MVITDGWNNKNEDMKLKAKDIAKSIGVSPATLSLVLNNKPGISDKTRGRVISQLKLQGFEDLLNDEVKEKPYMVNSKTIGFINYWVGGELLGENSFFPLIMDSLEGSAGKHGYSLSYINISKGNVSEGIERIKAADCCGIVIFATEMQEDDIEPFRNLGIPCVLLDNFFNDIDMNAVKVNNEQGTYLGVKHLVEKGHRKIGYLKSGLAVRSFAERCDMAVKAMKDFGIQEPERYIYETGYPSEKAYGAMKSLLDQKIELPTAFLADNDLVVLGAMKALKEHGYTLPDDISFVGFDDRPICSLSEPEITTIHIQRRYFGAEAVEILVRMLEGEADLCLKIEVNSELVERQSVKTL